MTAISFADTVRIRPGPITEVLGISGRVGQVYGITTPSSTGIEFAGTTTEDRAINVYFEELSKDFWLAPDLVELVDHSPGTTMGIGSKKSIRNADGTWREISRPWWKFWS